MIRTKAVVAVGPPCWPGTWLEAPHGPTQVRVMVYITQVLATHLTWGFIVVTDKVTPGVLARPTYQCKVMTTRGGIAEVIDYDHYLKGFMPYRTALISCLEHWDRHGIAWPHTQYTAIFGTSFRVSTYLKEHEALMPQQSIPRILPMPCIKKPLQGGACQSQLDGLQQCA